MNKFFLQTIALFFIFYGFSQRNPGEYNINILELNSKKSDFGVAFYGENKIIFSSSRDRSGKKWEGNNQSFLDLYECEVYQNGKTGAIKKIFSNVNTPFHESSVSFSPDNKTAYFTRNNSNDGEFLEELDSTTVKKILNRSRRKRVKKTKKKKILNLVIYKADILEGKWINIAPLPFNNKNYSVGHPAVNKNGTKLYFTSDMSGFGMSDIFVVDILPDGTYSEPQNLGKKVNTLGSELFPFIDDNNILYYASNYNNKGLGGLDVYAVKINEDNSISEQIHLPEPINTEFDDFSFIIDNATNKGYFSSNREKGGVGDDDIYHFNAITPLSFECEQQISGVIKDAKTSKIVTNTIVTITSDNAKTQIITSDFEGRFKISLACDTEFKFHATKDTYESVIKVLKTSGDYKKKGKIELRLQPINCNQNFDGIVYSTKEQTSISGALITVYNISGKKIANTKTDARGRFDVTLKCNSKYKITATKNEFEKEDKLVSSTKIDGDIHKVELNLKPILCNKMLSGFIYQEEGNLPLADAIVTVENENGVVIATTNSKQDGAYGIMLECKQKYKIIARKDTFEKERISFSMKKSDVAFDFTLKTEIVEIVKVRDKIIVNINPIFFDLDRANITRIAALELDKVVVIMKKYPNLKIEAGSHTDSRGPKGYNEKLSLRRARSTVSYIVKQGIDAARITAKGFGESQPTNRCVDGVKCDNDEYQQNRRTEFEILNPEILNLDN